MKRKLVILVTLAAFFVFGATMVRALLYAPESEVPAPGMAEDAPIEDVPESSHPDRLIIPRLDIDTDIQYVGVTASGNMGVPSNFTDVGWYKYGTVPGQRGSAVIDGHVDNGLGLAGVFKHLEDLDVGDDVFIETKGGSRLRFVVTEVATYGYKEVPGDMLFERADARRLNLITCGGSWIKAEKTYDERVVVYTVLVP
jgi:sortase A